MIHAEAVLLEHLNDPTSLDVLSDEGFTNPVSREVIPTDLVRKIVEWAIDYYWASGRKVGPTREALLETWGERMEAMEIVLGDPTEEIDSVEWAITQLRAQHGVSRSQRLHREMAAATMKADPHEKVAEIQKTAQAFYLLSQALSSRRWESAAGVGFEDSLMRHHDRKVNGHRMHGMTLGLDLIDQHTLGIHPGELAVFAMTSGGGKSWVAGHALLNAWRNGRKAVLVTLENDLEMTFDRLACMLARVDYSKYQRGEANEGDITRMLDSIDRLTEDPACEPVVTMLQEGERDASSIVRRCHSLGGVDLIVDQFSYMEKVPGSKSRERHQIGSETLRALKGELRDNPAGRLSCLLLAQINREGRTAARKSGRYEFEHLGITTELENIADYVACGFQTDDHRALERAVWQELKFRRGVRQDFDMWWRLGVGDIRPISAVKGEA